MIMLISLGVFVIFFIHNSIWLPAKAAAAL